MLGFGFMVTSVAERMRQRQGRISSSLPFLHWGGGGCSRKQARKRRRRRKNKSCLLACGPFFLCPLGVDTKHHRRESILLAQKTDDIFHPQRHCVCACASFFIHISHTSRTALKYERHYWFHEVVRCVV